jgi:hypothetical protein
MWRKDFLDLYFNPNPEKQDITSALELKNRNMPNFLYKYRPFNGHSLELLENDRMWLSNPEEFNDPFDCAATLISKKIEVENFRQRIDDVIDSLECEFTDNEKDHIKRSDDPVYELSKVYAEKFIPNEGTPKELIEAISKPEEYAKVISKALEENADDFYFNLIKGLKENMSIACFTEKKDSVLMWSHYADCHKGLCIEYDFKSLDYRNPLKLFLYPVIYADKVFDATESFLTTSGHMDIFKYAALTKFQDWSYESEWRLIDQKVMPGQDSPNLFSNPYITVTKPKSVYLGVKTAEDDINEVKKIAKDRDFKVYKMEMMDSEFILKPSRIM